MEATTYYIIYLCWIIDGSELFDLSNIRIAGRRYTKEEILKEFALTDEMKDIIKEYHSELKMVRDNYDDRFKTEIKPLINGWAVGPVPFNPSKHKKSNKWTPDPLEYNNEKYGYTYGFENLAHKDRAIRAFDEYIKDRDKSHLKEMPQLIMKKIREISSGEPRALFDVEFKLKKKYGNDIVDFAFTNERILREARNANNNARRKPHNNALKALKQGGARKTRKNNSKRKV